jgi:hypothetical protein
MPSWHAYADQPALAPGAQILITGGHMAVRILTADRLTIEMPDEGRLMAVVIDRTGEQLTLALGDSEIVRLHVASGDGFAQFQLSEGFSRQSWAVD